MRNRSAAGSFDERTTNQHEETGKAGENSPLSHDNIICTAEYFRDLPEGQPSRG
jgi:hypothetical protein